VISTLNQSAAGAHAEWTACVCFTVLAAAVAALLLAACATSHVMLGKARPPISPDQVRIYDRPPPGLSRKIGGGLAIYVGQ
jgi:hypothetical protein